MGVFSCSWHWRDVYLSKAKEEIPERARCSPLLEAVGGAS